MPPERTPKPPETTTRASNNTSQSPSPKNARTLLRKSPTNPTNGTTKQRQRRPQTTLNRLLARREKTPVLTFAPRAWLKLQYLCHAAATEVGGFGIARADDLLYIEDVITVKQHCTCASVEFDDAAVADFFDQQVEAGRKPEQFARIWIHTHPGDSATPSGLDENTFDRVFGPCNWAIMFILARDGDHYCRLRINSAVQNPSAVPKGVSDDGKIKRAASISLASTIPVRIDYERLIEDDAPIDHEAWLEEMKANVHHAGAFPSHEKQVDLDAFEIDDSVLDQLDLFDLSDDGLFEPIDEGRGSEANDAG